MLLSKLKVALVIAVLLFCVLPTITAGKPSEQARVLALCDQLYGPIIDRRMGLYAVNEFFVLKPVFDRRQLVTLYVEPKWYYDWYNVAWEAGDDFRNLSKTEYERLLTQVDQLKARGSLVKPASSISVVTNLTAWRKETYADATLAWGEVAGSQRPADAPVLVRWFRVYYSRRGAT
jgi:hypothetical protein